MTTTERKDSFTPIPASNQVVEINQLQQKVATRLLIIFFIPLIAVLALGVMAYNLSSRITEIETLERIIVVETNWQKTHNVQGTINAYEELARNVEYIRLHPQILVRLGALYFKEGDYQKAIDTLKRAKEFGGNDWEVHSVLSYIYGSHAKEQDSIIEGEKALSLNKFDAQTYNNLAWIYATSENKEHQDLNKAVEYATKAVEFTQGANLEYIDTLVEVHLRNGKKAEAIELLRKSITKAENKAPLPYLKTRLEKLQLSTK